MIIFGGRTNAGVALNDGAAYDPLADRWRPVTFIGDTRVPAARYYHRGIWTGEDMIVIGGAGSTGIAIGARLRP